MDVDVERRVRAFQRQLAEWSAAGRPGVPMFALPGTPEPGTCVSCGGPRGKELRCASCMDAVNVVIHELDPGDSPVISTKTGVC